MTLYLRLLHALLRAGCAWTEHVDDQHTGPALHDCESTVRALRERR